MINIERRKFLQMGTAAALSTCIGSAYAADAYALASTSAGRIRGRVKDGISSFLGVPYGRDTRLTRFQAPLPPELWKDVRDAFVYGDRAPQMGNHRSPGADSNKPRPDTYQLHPTKARKAKTACI